MPLLKALDRSGHRRGEQGDTRNHSTEERNCTQEGHGLFRRFWDAILHDDVQRQELRISVCKEYSVQVQQFHVCTKMILQTVYDHHLLLYFGRINEYHAPKFYYESLPVPFWLDG